jgi:hypothetical protein
MANTRRTAMGSTIDMDMLRIANEGTIAIGNMKVNARGDQLGAGGRVIKSRAQIMQDYHKINTPLASQDIVLQSEPTADMPREIVQKPSNVLQSAADDTPVAESETTPNYTKPRGSFAGAIAQKAEVNQELLPSPAEVKASKGIQRI